MIDLGGAGPISFGFEGKIKGIREEGKGKSNSIHSTMIEYQLQA